MSSRDAILINAAFGLGEGRLWAKRDDLNGLGAQTVPAFAYNNLTASGNRGGADITLAPLFTDHAVLQHLDVLAQHLAEPRVVRLDRGHPGQPR